MSKKKVEVRRQTTICIASGNGKRYRVWSESNGADEEHVWVKLPCGEQYGFGFPLFKALTKAGLELLEETEKA